MDRKSFFELFDYVLNMWEGQALANIEREKEDLKKEFEAYVKMLERNVDK
ncbi:hypothetical protein [Bacillus velezensis]|nr:hypothetical protein [Bacillus velezensis]MEC0405743.1 hypothetical protein [Bacillus velezensis]WPB65706.1 hypothetical protein SBK94_15090 [Bacillus velezensis]